MLDSLNAMLKGGDLGPAIVPGDPAQSLLFDAVNYRNNDLQMPPDGKLEDTEIALIREWIALGAAHAVQGPTIEPDAYLGPQPDDLWSVQPIDSSRLDSMQEHPVDQLWLEGLKRQELSPSEDAEPHEILRRLHYVLTGLSPTWKEIQEFERMAKTNLELAMNKTVDRLLASPQFGVRWARHWLDVARYADVSGTTNPAIFSQAWRYREWVIHSFNTDKPWQDFVSQQIAGDILVGKDPILNAEKLIATGYLALSHVLAVDRDKERLKLDTIDEQLDVIGRTFLGIQIGCARCHDHKIDPFPTRDYYAMAGILRNTDTIQASYSPESVKSVAPQLRDAWNQLPHWMQVGEGVKIHAVKDSNVLRNEPIHLRGEQDMLGEIVPRGMPAIVPAIEHNPIPQTSSGRVQLAEWLLAEENVLVARVIVNRVWHHVFGRGIVRSTDNFGLTGDLPSHPELLDLLAYRFRHHHQNSFKSLIKELVMSQIFRQSSGLHAHGLKLDPENKFLWRMNRRRSDAESLIDSIQWVSGSLDLTSTGGTAPKFKRGNQASTSQLEIPRATLRKRSIYWPVFRKDIPVALDFLSVFDFPPATGPRGRRVTTQVPAQSLALLNSDLVLTAAQRLRKSLQSTDEIDRIYELYRRVLSRDPYAYEIEAALAFVESFCKSLLESGAAKPENVPAVAWNRLCHTILACNEFITIP